MRRCLLFLAAVVWFSPCSAFECPAGFVAVRDKCITAPEQGKAREYRRPPISEAPGAAFGERARAHAGYRRADHLFPVRAYLGLDDLPPPGIGAYGVVVLRARPTDASRSRLLMMCQAFVSTLARQARLPPSVGPADQMLTVWPLDDPSDARAQNDDCGYAVDTYALTAGDQAAADAHAQGASFTGQGPYLVGWSPSDTRGVKDRLVLVVDMSDYNSQVSFNEALLFWKEKVVEDPALWRNGFSAERFRLALHDFADTYGQAVLDAFKLVSAK